MHPLSDFVSLGEELAGCLEVRRDLLVKRPAVNLEIAPFRLKSRRPDKRWPWDIWISIRWDRHALRLWDRFGGRPGVDPESPERHSHATRRTHAFATKGVRHETRRFRPGKAAIC